MAENITDLTANTFDETVLAAGVPVIVDFWAEWCGPCKMIAPILSEIAAEHAGKLQVAKVDVDSELELGRRFGVQSIPTLLVFDGSLEPAKRLVGAKGKSQLLQELSGFLETPSR